MKKAENLCRIVRNEKGCGTGEVTVLNNELKKLDPDGLLPETDPRVKKRKTANNWRYELECALRDFDAQDWK